MGEGWYWLKLHQHHFTAKTEREKRRRKSKHLQVAKHTTHPPNQINVYLTQHHCRVVMSSNPSNNPVLRASP